MSKLRNLIKDGFDVVELLKRLVEEIDQIREEIAEMRKQLKGQVESKP